MHAILQCCACLMLYLQSTLIRVMIGSVRPSHAHMYDGSWHCLTVHWHARSNWLTRLVLTLQIKRLCLSLPEQAPEGAALEAFLAHPDHVLARVSRDISQPEVAVSSLQKPMQVTSHCSVPPACP